MPLSGALEENILCLLCFDDARAQELLLKLGGAKVFSTRPYRTIAAAAISYIEKYNRPPKIHIADLLEEAISGHGEDGRFLQDTLELLYKLSKELQPDFVWAELDKFLKKRALEQRIVSASEALQSNDPERAQEILAQQEFSARVESGAFLHDADRMLEFLDVEDNEQDRFSCGVEELDRRGVRPKRGAMFLYFGRPKVGKTWWAVQMALVNALQYQKSVLHISLEVSLKELSERFVMSINAMTNRDVDNLRITQFKRDSLGRAVGYEFVNQKPRRLSTELRPELHQKLTSLRARQPIFIKHFPMRSLSIGQLNSLLDVLEKREKFRPDMVIVDYPDIMAVDRNRLREDTGTLFQDLRGLADMRNFALVCPTQGNRTRPGAKLITGDMVAEDWSKIMTADFVVTLNQTEREKECGLMRLYVDSGRSAPDKFVVRITQSIDTGQFCLSSAFMSGVLEAETKIILGADD